MKINAGAKPGDGDITAMAGGWPDDLESSDGKAGDYFEGGRIIVFMIGGMSFAEIRVSREVQDKENREVVAGSTCFIKATEFIEDIGSL